MSSQKFPKKEHLKGRKLIQTLFHNGKAFSIFPFRVYYITTNRASPSTPVRAGFSVPARRFKKAVDRNRIKRQMREAYRLQKQGLQQIVQNREQSIILFFIYKGGKIPAFPFLFEKMGITLKRITREIQKEDPLDEKAQ